MDVVDEGDLVSIGLLQVENCRSITDCQLHQTEITVVHFLDFLPPKVGAFFYLCDVNPL